MAKHPGLQMSKTRQNLWLKVATLEDFADHIDLLQRLYAKKIHRSDDGPYRADALQEDLEKLAETKRKNVKNEW